MRNLIEPVVLIQRKGHSELAVVISGSKAQLSNISGCSAQPICSEVQQLRIALWRKIFGLDVTAKQVGVAPAKQLESILEQPAAPETWRAIQAHANQNAQAFEKVFNHIPRNHASIWPTWPDEKFGSQPFELAFWTQHSEVPEPEDVAGFITSLPEYWTRRENNDSGSNLSVLAYHDELKQRSLQASTRRFNEGTT